MIALLATAAIMLIMDAAWLTANNAYHRKVFAALQGSPLEPRWIPAAAVYVIMIIAVWFFAVSPAVSVTDATGRGALLGLAMYGVYDFTNYATLTRYPAFYALTDVAWGTVLCAATAATAYWASSPA